MRLENWTKNALGREIPTRIAGRDFRPFAGSFAEMPEDAAHAARIPRRPFDGSSKVTTFETAFDAYLETEAREAFGRVTDRIFQDLTIGGQSERDAKQNALHFARTHFVRRFRAELPEWNSDGPTRVGDIRK